MHPLHLSFHPRGGRTIERRRPGLASTPRCSHRRGLAAVAGGIGGITAGHPPRHRPRASLTCGFH
ncbi:unnamed protein product [Spirodela intermedia]|uniref:Uncharacterized protein n=1 Tax=Spirodela intermedia TaxID=51605 RepID=A0A7I8JF94_SPIIN|nr:unnamed protein product [Spirodela intermedia]CAA6668826.1 unnamed protein product [Spirodela intermedia]